MASHRSFHDGVSLAAAALEKFELSGSHQYFSTWIAFQLLELFQKGMVQTQQTQGQKISEKSGQVLRIQDFLKEVMFWPSILLWTLALGSVEGILREETNHKSPAPPVMPPSSLSLALSGGTRSRARPKRRSNQKGVDVYNQRTFPNICARQI